MYKNNIQKKREERKCRILGHIVHEYVSTAMPISSKVVARKMRSNISSATVRNVMAELEEEGFIVQPHTSAGRIPTNSGYRRYVEMIKDRMRFEKEKARCLAAEYTLRIRTVREVIERTSYLISRELHNAGVVMWPNIEDCYLKHLELVKIKAETILAVLITVTNDVRNHIVRLDRDLKKTELERISSYINANYEHSTFSHISEDLRQMIGSPPGGEKGEILDIARTALKVVDAIVEENIENDVFWEGLNYFMQRDGSRDLDLTRKVLQIFSNRDNLIRLMREELPYRGIRFYIGEDSRGILRECSLITCGYTFHGRTAGRIGVIGPTRMDYDNVLGTVRCLSGLISAKLEEINT
ncbi:MAG: heat-inducible transcriptional repressor HrcA [Candidatus Omnitrophota bacterium]|nr:heat-inducible transcriptional repressor HrcA [Candidatus Omnitrophota bacterium]